MIPIQSSSMYNLSSTLLSGYSSMNNMKLSLALGGTSSAVSSISALQNSTYKGTSLSADDQSFLKSYQSKLTEMKAAANKVQNPSKEIGLAASSSSSKVATVSGTLSKATDSFTVNVEKLASGQKNQTETVSASGALPSIGGSLSIKTDTGKFDLNLSSAGAKSNKEAYENFASKINSANSGVTAKVIEKDGNVSLELTGKEGKSFSVSGSFAERTGLGNVAQERQDAVYSISKNGGTAQTFTSSTNNITLEGKLTAELKSVGETQIGSDKNASEAMADAMSELVASFNSTLSFLNKNETQGIGVLRQIRRMITSPTSEDSMNHIGISTNKDGSLSFDRTKFIEAMGSDSTLATSISQSVARGIESDASQGLREKSANLVSSSSQSGSSYDMSSISFLSAYNRSGIYNMMNLNAAGALLNISI